MIIYDTKLTMIQIYPYYREYAKNVQTCNVFQNNIEISPNKKLIHNKNKVHNNTTISENQSTIQVIHPLHLHNMISIITKSQHDGETKRLSSNFNCSIDNPMFLSTNVFSFNNLSRQYSKTPRTPPKKDLT